MARRSNWQKARDANTNGNSGQFGELLMAKILDCELSSERALVGDQSSQDFADIYNEDLGFRVEVKTCCNKAPFQIRLKQLRRYGINAHLPFPITDTLYALVSYKNQTAQKTKKGVKKNKNEGQKNFSPLSRLPMKWHRIKFIAERTDEIYILDRRIVRQLKRHVPVKDKPKPGRGNGPAMVANRTKIRKLLRDSTIEELAENFSIKPRHWVREIRTIDSTTVVDGVEYSVSCRLITILPKLTHERIAQTIRFRAPSGNA